MTANPIQNLRKFLLECASNNDYNFNNNTRREIRYALFQAASLNGKYIKEFFPHLDNSKVKGKVSLGSTSSSPKSSDWIINNSNKIDPSHPGRPCVRKFAKGEPTYRCLYVAQPLPID